MPVTSIGDSAFKNYSNLKSVTIGNSVTSIAKEAFHNCSNLTGIIIPDSVTNIGSYAFKNCSKLTSVTIGNGITSIGTGVFSSCSNITNISIPDSVTSIGSYAFKDCKCLSNVTMPDSITSIGDSAFEGCYTLESIAIPDSITSIGDSAFFNCQNLTNVYITDVAKWCNISFGDFSANPLYYAKKMYLNNDLITDLEIPNGVTEIKPNAFYHCTHITNVKIPNSVTSIGSYAFYNCNNLTSVTIPDSITNIDLYAFDACDSLIEVINKSSLEIKKGSSDYGNIAYRALEIHNGDSKIVNKNGYLFYTYESVNYLVKHVGTATQLTLPESYNGENYNIHNFAFFNCFGLTSVTIPESVMSIGAFAFANCDYLTSIEFKITEGWKTGPTNIMLADYLSNKEYAAKYLTNTYCDRTWTRSNETV